MRIPHLTPEQFCADGDHVTALRDFLTSETGHALISVLQGFHPMRQLADSRTARGGNNLRAIAAAESELGRAENLLGRCEGYESAIELLTQVLTERQAAVPPKSRKAGGQILPAPAPKS